MRKQILLAVLISLFIGPARAQAPDPDAPASEQLTSDDLQAMAAEPDDRSSVPEALKVYPAATEYRMSVKFGAPGEEPTQSDEVMVREKLVRGKYLVSTFRPPAADRDWIMAVFYDPDPGVYKKFVLFHNGVIAESTGTRVEGSRTLSWISVSPDGPAEGISLSQEVHTAEKTIWREVGLSGGKVVQVQEGIATVTRKAAAME